MQSLEAIRPPIYPSRTLPCRQTTTPNPMNDQFPMRELLEKWGHAIPNQHQPPLPNQEWRNEKRKKKKKETASKQPSTLHWQQQATKQPTNPHFAVFEFPHCSQSNYLNMIQPDHV